MDLTRSMLLILMTCSLQQLGTHGLGMGVQGGKRKESAAKLQQVELLFAQGLARLSTDLVETRAVGETRYHKAARLTKAIPPIMPQCSNFGLL